MLSLSRLHIILLSFSLAFFGSSPVASAQEAFTVKYNDSLTTEGKSQVTYNTIKVTNPGKDILTLKGEVIVPTGWKNLFSNVIDIAIEPNSTYNIPVNLLSSKTTSANWKTVQVKLWQNDDASKAKTYSYLVKTQEKPAFVIQKLTDELYYDEYPGEIKLGVYLKNTGNVADVYELHFLNKFFAIDKKINISLKQGQDTSYYLPLKMSKRTWKEMNKEDIYLNVAASGENHSILSYNISRPKYTLKENPSAFNTVPLTVEAGMFAFGNVINYYGGLKTAFRVGDHNFGFSYRSRQLSNVNSNNIQRDIFLFDYKYKHFVLRAGTFANSQNFLLNGNSLSVGWVDKDFSIFVTGTKSNKLSLLMQGDNIGVLTSYYLGKVKVENNAEVNIDKGTNVNSYVVDNRVEIVKNNDVELTAKVSGSVEQKTKDMPGVEKTAPGYGGGYVFNINKPKFSFYSFIDHYSRNFPGYRRGTSITQQTIKYKMTQRSFAGLQYSSSYMQRNYFRDSLYNSDVLSYNNTKYGAIFGTSTERNNFTLGAGLMQQRGDFTSNLFNKYYFVELNESYNIDQKLMLNYGTLTGLSTSRSADNNPVWISSQNINMQYHFFGISTMYLRNVLVIENNPQVYETITGGPYITFKFFRNKLYGNIRFNMARTVQDDDLRTGLGAALTYQNSETGTRVNLNGYLPFQKFAGYRLPFNEQKYGFINVVQDIHIPVKRKYYDLKVVIYNDANSNGVKDAEENFLKDIPVDINDNTLFTNETGVAQYRNIKNGYYSVGVYKAYAEEGLIPTNGPQQVVSVDKKDAVINLPFKKGRVISGNVRIIQDALNTNQIESQFIKIIATDSLDRKYTTLTDEEGNFFLYVPEGLFKVSLSPDAFTSNVKPVKLSYNVDIVNNESAFVAFELKQKKRQVRFLNQTIAKPEDKKPKDGRVSMN